MLARCFQSAAVAALALLVPSLPACRAQVRASTQDQHAALAGLIYPDALRGDTVDDYHGTQVADPYRWLEDPDSPETRAWVEAENKVTFGYLDEIPQRNAIRQRLTELWNYERFGVPTKKGGHYFLTRNDGLQNQSVLYVLDDLAASPRVLLDPNTLAKDGTVALSGTVVSEDGRLLAYGLADGGSDWNQWKVRDVATGQDLADTLRWVKFSQAAWMRDGSGFFYARYDEPKAGEELVQANYFHKLYFHKLGTAQAEDPLVYERPDHKEWLFQSSVSEDGAYLLIEVSQGTEQRNRYFYKRLADPGAPVLELLGEADAHYEFVGNDGAVFWFLTDRDAPRARLVAIDTADPQASHASSWKELVPQAKETLTGVSVVGEHFVASYLQDAHTAVRVFDLAGKLQRSVGLPGLGTATGFAGERPDPETFYSFTGFTTPTVIFRYDVATGASEVFRKPALKYDPSGYTTEQVFYRSKDGTRVPMFLTYKQGLVRDGSSPALLYGYGGFNIPLTPSFSPARIAWMERGGIFAVANLRGGGEYGEEWHLAGTKLRKNNVFDDFIAAAEWLIREHYTSPSKLAIQGGSNGGLLVGACLTQRPELFGAALPAVGVLDMLRFHKFTIGWAWVSDYGCSDNPDEFRALYAYSPYHRVRRGSCYPPTMITTADHDDRVVPAHSFKFAAALQWAQSCDSPILIRIDVRAGHGAGKPTTKLIEQAADEMSFLVRELGTS
jgi:prolyl oligopeptidase